jgi:hypothetical protein
MIKYFLGCQGCENDPSQAPSLCQLFDSFQLLGLISNLVGNLFNHFIHPRGISLMFILNPFISSSFLSDSGISSLALVKSMTSLGIPIGCCFDFSPCVCCGIPYSFATNPCFSLLLLLSLPFFSSSSSFSNLSFSL